MGNYWARFSSRSGEIFRFDTRIYLHAVEAPKKADPCLGAIVGKNPGKAKPSKSMRGMQSIALDGDKLLPTVRSIVSKAYESAKSFAPVRGYIQVLNLFYLCDHESPRATRTITAMAKPPKLCESEKRKFPWVWYAWGGPSRKLDHYKMRFANIEATRHFFLDYHLGRVTRRQPRVSEFAKHTQGLTQAPVIHAIAKFIAAG